MTTPVLPLSIINKIKSRSQAVRWTVVLKEVRVFAAYCCNINADGIMGVAKAPVPIIDINPNPVCLTEAIDWDLTDSYAPGSTISSWTIDFGDSNNATGSLIADAHGSHTYADVGSFTVTVTVEEGGGRSASLTREVNVIDCSTPPVKWVYASTYGHGVWFLDRNAGSIVWESRNAGLAGNALYVHSMVMRPGQDHLKDGSHEIWIATRDGVYKSLDSGNSWAKLMMPDPSNAEFSDSPAAVVGDLDWAHIVFDPIDNDIVYIRAVKYG
jgi:PKD repeat protein